MVRPRGRNRVATGVSSQMPGLAVFGGQPFGISGAVDELFPRRVPIEFLLVMVGLIDKVADGGGAVADLDVQNLCP